MGRVEEAVRSAVARVVERKCREACAPLVAEIRQVGQRVARLEAEVALLRGQKRKKSALRTGAPLKPMSEAEVRRARLTPDAIKALRARLGLTQVKLAALLGVTGPAVAQWEMGATAPRGNNRAALVALRGLGRRAVARMLDSPRDPKPRAPRH